MENLSGSDVLEAIRERAEKLWDAALRRAASGSASTNQSLLNVVFNVAYMLGLDGKLVAYQLGLEAAMARSVEVTHARYRDYCLKLVQLHNELAHMRLLQLAELGLGLGAALRKAFTMYTPGMSGVTMDTRGLMSVCTDAGLLEPAGALSGTALQAVLLAYDPIPGPDRPQLSYRTFMRVLAAIGAECQTDVFTLVAGLGINARPTPVQQLVLPEQPLDLTAHWHLPGAGTPVPHTLASALGFPSLLETFPACIEDQGQEGPASLEGDVDEWLREVVEGSSSIKSAAGTLAPGTAEVFVPGEGLSVWDGRDDSEGQQGPKAPLGAPVGEEDGVWSLGPVPSSGSEVSNTAVAIHGLIPAHLQNPFRDVSLRKVGAGLEDDEDGEDGPSSPGIGLAHILEASARQGSQGAWADRLCASTGSPAADMGGALAASSSDVGGAGARVHGTDETGRGGTAGSGMRVAEQEPGASALGQEVHQAGMAPDEKRLSLGASGAFGILGEPGTSRAPGGRASAVDVTLDMLRRPSGPPRKQLTPQLHRTESWDPRVHRPGTLGVGREDGGEEEEDDITQSGMVAVPSHTLQAMMQRLAALEAKVLVLSTAMPDTTSEDGGPPADEGPTAASCAHLSAQLAHLSDRVAALESGRTGAGNDGASSTNVLASGADGKDAGWGTGDPEPTALGAANGSSRTGAARQGQMVQQGIVSPVDVGALAGTVSRLGSTLEEHSLALDTQRMLLSTVGEATAAAHTVAAQARALAVTLADTQRRMAALEVASAVRSAGLQNLAMYLQLREAHLAGGLAGGGSCKSGPNSGAVTPAGLGVRAAQLLRQSFAGNAMAGALPMPGSVAGGGPGLVSSTSTAAAAVAGEGEAPFDAPNSCDLTPYMIPQPHLQQQSPPSPLQDLDHRLSSSKHHSTAPLVPSRLRTLSAEAPLLHAEVAGAMAELLITPLEEEGVPEEDEEAVDQDAKGPGSQRTSTERLQPGRRVSFKRATFVPEMEVGVAGPVPWSIPFQGTSSVAASSALTPLSRSRAHSTSGAAGGLQRVGIYTEDGEAGGNGEPSSWLSHAADMYARLPPDMQALADVINAMVGRAFDMAAAVPAASASVGGFPSSTGTGAAPGRSAPNAAHLTSVLVEQGEAQRRLARQLAALESAVIKVAQQCDMLQGDVHGLQADAGQPHPSTMSTMPPGLQAATAHARASVDGAGLGHSLMVTVGPEAGVPLPPSLIRPVVTAGSGSHPPLDIAGYSSPLLAEAAADTVAAAPLPSWVTPAPAAAAYSTYGTCVAGDRAGQGVSGERGLTSGGLMPPPALRVSVTGPPGASTTPTPYSEREGALRGLQDGTPSVGGSGSTNPPPAALLNVVGVGLGRTSSSRTSRATAAATAASPAAAAVHTERGGGGQERGGPRTEQYEPTERWCGEKPGSGAQPAHTYQLQQQTQSSHAQPFSAHVDVGSSGGARPPALHQQQQQQQHLQAWGSLPHARERDGHANISLGGGIADAPVTCARAGTSAVSGSSDDEGAALTAVAAVRTRRDRGQTQEHGGAVTGLSSQLGTASQTQPVSGDASKLQGPPLPSAPAPPARSPAYTRMQQQLSAGGGGGAASSLEQQQQQVRRHSTLSPMYQAGQQPVGGSPSSVYGSPGGPTRGASGHGDKAQQWATPPAPPVVLLAAASMQAPDASGLPGSSSASPSTAAARYAKLGLTSKPGGSPVGLTGEGPRQPQVVMLQQQIRVRGASYDGAPGSPTSGGNPPLALGGALPSPSPSSSPSTMPSSSAPATALHQQQKQQLVRQGSGGPPAGGAGAASAGFYSTAGSSSGRFQGLHGTSAGGREAGALRKP